MAFLIIHLLLLFIVVGCFGSGFLPSSSSPRLIKLIDTMRNDSFRPKLAEFRSTIEQIVGTRLKLLCSIQQGLKPFTFDWRKNNQILPVSLTNDEDDDYDGDWSDLKQTQRENHKKINYKKSHGVSIKVKTSMEDSFLIIENLNITDSGLYSCTVINHYGKDQQSTRLIVKGLFLF